MKIQAGGCVQSLLVAEQSVSSTSDLPSRGEPFYRLTGTNPPMWLPLICASDTLFLQDLKLLCFIFFAQSNQQPLGMRGVYIIFFSYFLSPQPPTAPRCWRSGKRVPKWNAIILDSFITKFQSHAVLCQSFVFHTAASSV